MRIVLMLRFAIRIPLLSLVGVLTIVLATAYYSYDQSFMHYFTPERALTFQRLAYSYLLSLLLGVLLVGFSLYLQLKKRNEMIKKLDSIPLDVGALVPYVLSQRRYSNLFTISSLLYGLFYSFITSIIVYQPEVNFSEAYLAKIPSILVGPCCGPPLYVPITTVYLTEHLGLLLIPLSLILLFIVSTLVGLNLTLTTFAYRNRLKKGGKGLFGGIGAIVGLFTGCPTCAGLFFANIVGGAGVTAFATLLSYYQPLFIGLSIPVLLATPFLISRSLSKVFTDGCITLH
jgi:hypothetical protein